MNCFKQVLFFIAALYVLIFSGCSLNEEGVFDAVVQIDAPWKACEGKSIPLVINVTNGDKYPVYLESLAIWDINTSSPISQRDFMNSNPPDYVAIFRRDWGERMMARPLKEDTFNVNTPFQELELSPEGKPANLGIRIFKLKSNNYCVKKVYQEKFQPGCVRKVIRLGREDCLNIGPIGKITTLVSDILEAGCNVIDTVCFGHLFGRQWSEMAVADVLAAVNIHNKIERQEDKKGYTAKDTDVMKSPFIYSDFNEAVKWVFDNYDILKEEDGIKLEDFLWKGDKRQPRYIYAVASYRTESSGEIFKQAVLFLPAFMSVWYHSIDYIWNGNPYNKQFYNPFSKDFWNAMRQYSNTQNSPQYIKKVMRIEPDEKGKNESILANSETNSWLAGDPHVHTRYTHNQAETGNGIRSTGLAAHAIGLDWVTITDHASDTLDWDMNQDRFLEQKREIAAFNLSNTAPLLIQAHELTLAPQYDPGKNTYHILCYQMDDPDFLSGKITQAPVWIGFRQLSQVLFNKAFTGSAIRSFVEVLNELPAKRGFAFIAHPRDVMRNAGVFKSCMQWQYQDFLTAIDSPSVRGLQIWNVDISGKLNISTFRKAHALDLGRINHWGIFNDVVFCQMMLMNIILSPVNYGMKQFGLSGSPIYWMFYPKFDVVMDPRKGIDTTYLSWFHEKVAEGFISGSPWVIFGIIDVVTKFSYRTWAFGFVGLGVLSNAQGWMDKKKSDDFIYKIEDGFDYAWRVMLTPVTAISRKPLEQSEAPFLEKEHSDRFWQRHLSRKSIFDEYYQNIKEEKKNREEERIKYFKNIRTSIFTPASIRDFPKFSPEEINYRHDQEWKWVKKSVSTKNWVQLSSGIDLWDYGIMIRMKRTLDNHNNKGFSLDDLACNTAEMPDGRGSFHNNPASMLRLVASAGSDAHGAFNYQVSTMTRFEINIMNYALGKVRTVVRIPDICNPDKKIRKEMILTSLANGSSILTNGPECFFELKNNNKIYPLGSVVVVDSDKMNEWSIIIKMKEDIREKSEESLFVGRVFSDKKKTTTEADYVDAYERVFREDSRCNTGFFDALSLYHYGYKYGYEDRDLIKRIEKLPLHIRKSAYSLVSRIRDNEAIIPVRIRNFRRLGYNPCNKDTATTETLEIPLRQIIDYKNDISDSTCIAYIRYELETFNTQTGETHNCFTNPIWIVIKGK